jgi:CIC family chloride channel protein
LNWLQDLYRRVVPPREESAATGVTMVAAGMVGVGAGAVSLGMEWLTRTMDMRQYVPAAGWGLGARVLVPVVVFVFVAWLLRRFVPEATGVGISSLMTCVGRRGGYIRPRVIPLTALTTSLTIAAGAPLGLEGPVAQAGAGVGSLAGRRLRLGTANIRILVGAGAAGAIAAKYGAPIGGAVFAAEIILGGAGAGTLLPLIAAAFLAVLTRAVVHGPEAAEYAVPALLPLNLPDHLRMILLGTACGVGAAVFIKMFYRLQDAMDRALPSWWTRAVFAGLVIGGVGLLLPRAALSTGRDLVQRLLAGDAALAAGLLVFLVVARPVLTALGLGARVSGGIFMPALLAGAALGTLAARAFGIDPAHTTPYVLVGMAAMVAAAMRAPLQAVLIIFELTRDYRVVPALMIACAISVKLSEVLEPDSFFTRALVRSGERFQNGMDLSLLDRLRISEVMKTDFVSLPLEADIREVADSVRRSENRTFPVADRHGHLQGLVMLSRLIAAATHAGYSPGAAEEHPVRELLEPDLVYLRPNDTASEAWRVMGNYDYDCLPVCESQEGGLRVVGICEKESIVERVDREAFVELQERISRGETIEEPQAEHHRVDGETGRE